MKTRPTFLMVAILLIVLVCPGFILMSASDYYLIHQFKLYDNSFEPEQNNAPQNETSTVYFAADTFDIDIDMDDFDEEMEKLHKELAKLKSYKFEFDFDNEEFRAGMEELKKELSNLELEDFQFKFDSEEFRKSMALLKKELKDHKFTFYFDVDNFKEEMEVLKDELKDLKFDLKDLDIKLDKLDGFMESLREELQSDGLIDNKDDDFNMELNKDEMLINGKQVQDELFKKYKDIYEEHLGRKLDDEYNIIIR